MERTTTITLGGMSYSLTESAYARLSSYLERLKSHFAAEDGADEIMSDIESRIAEKLFHKKDSIVSEDDIAAVIAEIGEASEFDDENEAPPAKSARKKLYRDTENGWVGGVCAGLGEYFDVDPLWIRLVFLASIFFGGTGIFIYIILWVLIPEAKTSGQKLEMKGHPVNLEGIARIVREGVEEARESGAVQRSVTRVGRLVRAVLRIFGKILGIILVIDTFIASVALVIATGIVAVNWNAPYNDFPLRGVVPDALLFGGLAMGFLAILIPLIFLFSLGIRLIFRKQIIPSAIGFGLVGLWFFAVCAAGTIAATSAGKFFEHTRTAPEYQMETRELELESFSNLNVNGERVTIKKGDVQKVTVSGNALDMDRDSFEVKDGTLTITKKSEDRKLCIFCRTTSPEITIVTPDLTTVRVEHGTLTFDDYTDTTLSITLLDGFMRGTLTTDTLSIDSDNSSIRAEVISETFSLKAEDSYVELNGSATEATLTIDDTSLQAGSFAVESATLTTDGSYGEVDVQNLTMREDSSSHILNEAAPSAEREEN